MSFQRVNPGGYGAGSIVHSGAFNQLDVDHAKALDKSIAGDQLQGTITMDTGGRIQASVPGGLQSTVPGGFALTGGSTDWPTFGVSGLVPRSRLNLFAMVPYPSFATGWTQATALAPLPAIAGPATAQGQFLVLPPLHNAATLASITIYFWVSDPHGAGAPQHVPTFSLTSISPTGGPGGTVTTIASGSPATPASGAAWYAGGNMQSWTVTVGGTIDRTSLIYMASLTDEWGTHSVAGNGYLGMLFTFTQITNMAFP